MLKRIGVILFALLIAAFLLGMAYLMAACSPLPVHADPLPTRTAITHPSVVVETLTPTPQPTAAPSASATATIVTCRVTGTNGQTLNVRSCAGMECSIKGSLLPGERVVVLSRSEGWLLVSGQLTGFVARDYCK